MKSVVTAACLLALGLNQGSGTRAAGRSVMSGRADSCRASRGAGGRAGAGQRRAWAFTCGAAWSIATAWCAAWRSPEADRGDQWPGSRVISAQKANTANAFSLPKFALSTANLFSAVQPGQSLFGLQESNPVDTGVAYGGNAALFGQPNDPMRGKRVGGVNVFGGGLALYTARGDWSARWA